MPTIVVKNSFKNRLKMKYNFKKRELKYKLESVKEKFILNFIMPQFLDYVRGVIVAKGLDPDRDPFVKQIKPNNVVENLITILDQTNSGSTRGRSTYFNHYIPKWVSDSFRDKTKHILYKNINKTLPVEEKPQSMEVTVGVVPDEVTDLGFVVMKDLTDKFPIVSEGNLLLLDTVEERADARSEIIETAKKDLNKKAVKSTKKQSVVRTKSKKTAMKHEKTTPVKDLKFKGSFKRV